MTHPKGITAHELLDRAFRHFSDRSLVTMDDVTLTYKEVWNKSSCLSNALRELGVKKGDLIGVMMSNQPEYIIANLSCLQSGFVNIPMNDMLTEDEFHYMLSDSGAKAAIVGEKFIDTISRLEPELPQLQFVIVVSENGGVSQTRFLDLVDDGDPEKPNVSIQPDDLLRLSYTGGTTGKPKGAKHTHGVLGMNMLAHLGAFEIRDSEKMLIATPLPHAAGYMHLAGMIQGAHFVITEEFNSSEFLDLVESESVTWTFLVPTMLYRLLDHPAINGTDISSLDTIVYGAAPITAERLEQALETFGQIFIQGYGQTEMPDVGMVLPKLDHVADEPQIESCGRPAVMVKAGLCDPNNEDKIELLEHDRIGELVLRSPYLMDGYHNKPDQTADTLVDGWLRTGDIAKCGSDGFYYLLDRKKDIIISGGMNVYTTEVEEALSRHPKVDEVAVIGVPHQEWGEAVHAIIVSDGTASIPRSNLKDFVEDSLSPYKIPKSVEYVDELPTTPYGKVDKKKLREPFWEDNERSVN